MIFHNWPYSDLYTQNLDWLLKRTKDLEGNVAQIKKRIEQISPDPLTAEPSFVTVGRSGCDYETLGEALRFARGYCTPTNRVCLLIAPGTYREAVTLLPNPGIDMIGCGDVRIIAPSDVSYPQTALYTAGDGFFSGIRFETGAAEQDYAVHFEVQTVTGQVRGTRTRFHNCQFHGMHQNTRGLGAGGGANCTLEIDSCFIQGLNGNTGAYFHNYPHADGDETGRQFSLIVKNTSIYGGTRAVTLDEYTENLWACTFLGCTYYPAATLQYFDKTAGTDGQASIPASSHIIWRGCSGNSSPALDGLFNVRAVTGGTNARAIIPIPYAPNGCRVLSVANASTDSLIITPTAISFEQTGPEFVSAQISFY